MNSLTHTGYIVAKTILRREPEMWEILVATSAISLIGWAILGGLMFWVLG